MAAEKQIQAPFAPAELAREPLVNNNRSVGWISDQVSAIIEGKTPAWWWAAFVPSFLMMCLLGCMLIYKCSVGVGVWVGVAVAVGVGVAAAEACKVSTPASYGWLQVLLAHWRP